jgi:peptide/nickel transport system permease protein
MGLTQYLIRRLILTIPMLLGITFALFAMYTLTKVDPIVMLVGERQLNNEELVAQTRAHWGLDRPPWEQYLSYLGNYLRGDFGTSFLTRRPVVDDLLQYLPATIELGFASLLFAVVVGIPLGILAGVRQGGLLDRGVWGLSLLNASLPPFWTGLIVLFVFYYYLGVMPGPGRIDPRMAAPPHATGFYTVDSLLAGDWTSFLNVIHHLMLPAFILGSFTLAIVMRITRASIIDEMRRDYIRTARSKGLAERKVVVGHALRNAMIPLMTILGLAFAGLLSGAVMTETIFDWPGLGTYLVQAASSLDYPAIQGGTLLIAVIYVGINLVVDVLYGVVDPRVRHE